MDKCACGQHVIKRNLIWATNEKTQNWLLIGSVCIDHAKHNMGPDVATQLLTIKKLINHTCKICGKLHTNKYNLCDDHNVGFCKDCNKQITRIWFNGYCSPCFKNNCKKRECKIGPHVGQGLKRKYGART